MLNQTDRLDDVVEHLPEPVEVAGFPFEEPGRGRVAKGVEVDFVFRPQTPVSLAYAGGLEGHFALFLQIVQGFGQTLPRLAEGGGRGGDVDRHPTSPLLPLGEEVAEERRPALVEPLEDLGEG